GSRLLGRGRWSGPPRSWCGSTEGRSRTPHVSRHATRVVLVRQGPFGRHRVEVVHGCWGGQVPLDTQGFPWVLLGRHGPDHHVPDQGAQEQEHRSTEEVGE